VLGEVVAVAAVVMPSSCVQLAVSRLKVS